MDKKNSPYKADQAATVTFEIIKDGSKFLFVMPQMCNLQWAYDSLQAIAADIVEIAKEGEAREKKKKEEAAKEKDSKDPKVEEKKEEGSK